MSTATTQLDLSRRARCLGRSLATRTAAMSLLKWAAKGADPYGLGAIHQAAAREASRLARAEERLFRTLDELTRLGHPNQALRLCADVAALRLDALGRAHASTIGYDQAPGWAFTGENEHQEAPCRGGDAPTRPTDGGGSPREATGTGPSAPSAASPTGSADPRSTADAGS